MKKLDPTWGLPKPWVDKLGDLILRLSQLITATLRRGRVPDQDLIKNNLTRLDGTLSALKQNYGTNPNITSRLIAIRQSIRRLLSLFERYKEIDQITLQSALQNFQIALEQFRISFAFRMDTGDSQRLLGHLNLAIHHLEMIEGDITRTQIPETTKAIVTPMPASATTSEANQGTNVGTKLPEHSKLGGKEKSGGDPGFDKPTNSASFNDTPMMQSGFQIIGGKIELEAIRPMQMGMIELFDGNAALAIPPDAFEDEVEEQFVLNCIALADELDLTETSNYLNLADLDEIAELMTTRMDLLLHLIDHDYEELAEMLSNTDVELTDEDILLINAAVICESPTQLATFIQTYAPEKSVIDPAIGMPLIGPTQTTTLKATSILRVIK